MLNEAQLQAIRQNSKDETSYQAILDIMHEMCPRDLQLLIILDNLPAPAYLADEDGCYRFINRAFEAFFDIHAADAVEHYPQEVFPLELAAQFNHLQASIAQGNAPTTLEHRLGEKIFLVHHFPTNPGSYPTCYVLTDITEHKWMQEVYSLLVDQASQGFEIFQDGRIVFANQAYADMLGYTVDELLAMDEEQTRQITYYEDQKQVWERHDERIAGQRSAEVYEVRLVRRDGSVFWAEVRVSPTVFQGRPSIHAAILNIDERKLAETSERELVLEREKVRVLTTFVQAATHEFGTPLSVINTNVHILRKVLEPKEGDRISQSLKQIHNESHKIHRLVTMLLTMSRLDSWSLFTYEEVSINTLIDQVLVNYTGKTSLEIRIKTQPSLPKVWAASRFLWEAFSQIIDNAVKYAATYIAIRAYTLDNGVSIQISDDGQGIEPEILEHVFDRFFRADQARSTPGFGLGLSIAKKVVELHDGTITLQSEVGKGTTVTIWLPMSGSWRS